MKRVSTFRSTENLGPSSSRVHLLGRPPQKTRICRLLGLSIIVLALAVAPNPSSATRRVELVTPGGHDGAIRNISSTSGQPLIVSGSEDGTIKMWDPEQLRLLRTLPAHSRLIGAMSVSPDGQLVASGGADHFLRIWSVKTGKLVHELRLDQEIWAIAWPSDATQCVASSTTGLRILDRTKQGWKLRDQPPLRASASLAFATGSHHLAGSLLTGFRIWNTDSSGAAEKQGALAADIQQLVGIPAGFIAAAGDALWLLPLEADIKPELRITVGTRINGFSIDPQSGTVATVGTNERLEIWDWESGAAKYSIELPRGVHTSVAILGDAGLAAVGTLSGSIHVVSLDEEEVIGTLEGGRNTPIAVDFEGDQVSGLIVRDRAVQLWALPERGRPMMLRDKHPIVIQDAQLARNAGLVIARGLGGATVWSSRTGRIERRVEIPYSTGSRFRCNSDAMCAWEDGGVGQSAVTVSDLRGSDSIVTHTLGQAVVTDLAVDPDSERIAVALNGPTVRVLSTRRANRGIDLELEAAAIPVGSKLLTVPGKLAFASAGMATSVHFGDDGKKLAAANRDGIHVWNPIDSGARKVLKPSGAAAILVRWVGSDRILSADELGRVDLWSEDGTSVRVAELGQRPVEIAMDDDRKFLLAAFAGGSVQLWKASNRSLAATIVFPIGSTGWAMAGPNGLIDASEGAWQEVRWRLQEDTRLSLPAERFFRDYYYPGLLEDVLEERKLPVPMAIGQLDRSVPAVTLTILGSEAGVSELVIDGDTVRTVHKPATTRLLVEAVAAASGGGIYDLTVMQNHTLAQKWPGKLRLSSNKYRAAFTVEQDPAGDLFSAYAFNRDGVRSESAELIRAMTGHGFSVPQRTLHIVAIGVSQYQNEEFNLAFPSKDLALIRRALEAPESQWQNLHRRLSDELAERTFETLSTQRPMDAPARVAVKTVLNAEATRGGILATLSELTSTARPHDAVVVYFSGHGVSDGKNFFLLPYDMSLTGDPSEVTPNRIRDAASSLVSDDDLANALRPLRSVEGALILDACRSGQALVGAESVGPLNLRGLGRLAYEKGFHLLAAAQADQPAVELRALGNSVLTHALFQEGILNEAADCQPKDGYIEMREWLGYGAGRVHGLIGEYKPTAPRETLPRARFAPRLAPETTSIVVGPVVSEH